MNKTKLKIMELLGEFVDKELKFGCKLKYYNGFGSYVCSFGEMNSIEDIDTQMKRGHDQIYIKRDGQERLDNELIENLEDKSKIEIIGQYGLHNILMWFHNNTRIDFHLCLDGLFYSIFYEYEIILDLTKPPMERTEEQDKELLEFMQNVLDSNK